MLAELANEKIVDRTPRLALELATGSSDIAAAQRLRHRVFVEEMGARVTGRNPGQEQDFFDPWCEHLIVRHQASGDVVGTCRLLTAQNARRLGTLCAEREFDLTRLIHFRPQLIEVGRACVDRAYRTGSGTCCIGFRPRCMRQHALASSCVTATKPFLSDLRAELPPHTLAAGGAARSPVR